MNAYSPPAQAHSPTSQAAARLIKPEANRLRAQVLACLTAAGNDGMTDEQIIDATGLGASTARPRRIELVEQGRVKASGLTRPTRSGRAATVWCVCPLVATEPHEPEVLSMADYFSKAPAKMPD